MWRAKHQSPDLHAVLLGPKERLLISVYGFKTEGIYGTEGDSDGVDPTKIPFRKQVILNKLLYLC